MELAAFWFGFAICTAFVANLQGRNVARWFLLGSLFGVFAFFTITFLPLYAAIQSGRLARPLACSDCLCPVSDDDAVCAYCGRQL